MSPIRVVRVLGALDVGGAERRMLELLTPLARAGVEVHFVTLSGREGVLADLAKRQGAYVHPIKLDLLFPLRFFRLIRALKARVVHSDVATFSGAVVALGRLARASVRITHFHSDGDGYRDSIPRRLQRNFMCKLIRVGSTDILGVAPGALEYGYSKEWRRDQRCRVVPNGIDVRTMLQPGELDLRQLTESSSGDLLFLHVGRPSPEKRRWLIPSMIGELRRLGVTGQAAFAGPRHDSDDTRLMEAAADARVSDHMHLLGSVENVGDLLRQADVLILPSDREGLPGAVLEAVALGTPVVASDLPGVRYISKQLPGITLVDPGASAADWARALAGATARRVTADDRFEAMARFEASIFSIEASVNEHLGLYRAVPFSGVGH